MEKPRFRHTKRDAEREAMRQRQCEQTRAEFAQRLRETSHGVQEYVERENELRKAIRYSGLTDAQRRAEIRTIETSRAVEKAVLDSLDEQAKSIIDPLTGARNRRGFEEAMQTAYAMVHRYRYKEESSPARSKEIPESEQFVLISFDLDGFKQVNDSKGHAAGDQVLKDIVANIKLRPGDVLARPGGDEFYIICLDSMDNAVKLAERIRKTIEGTTFNVIDNNGVGRAVHITISVGISPYDNNAQFMEKMADKALYAAKGKDEHGNDIAGAESTKNQTWVFDKSQGRSVKATIKDDFSGVS